jgi:integrase
VRQLGVEICAFLLRTRASRDTGRRTSGSGPASGGARSRPLSDWIFPADTHSGHIETGTLKKQREKALTASEVPAFVPYDLRHTCLTRWSKVMDPFTLKKLAGHADLNTTMRYVHLNDEDVRAAMDKARSGHKSWHNANWRIPIRTHNHL